MAFFITLGIFLFIVLVIYLVKPTPPPKYLDLSLIDLQRHITSLNQTLYDKGTVHIKKRGVKTAFIIEKGERKKSNILILRIRSGYSSRKEMAIFEKALDQANNQYQKKYTKKKNLLKELYLSFPADDPITASAFTNILTLLNQSFNSSSSFDYSIHYQWPLNDSELLTDEHPVKPTSLSKIGYVVGRYLRYVVDLFRR